MNQEEQKENDRMKSGLMLGVNPNTEREKNDFYATNPHALEIAMPIFKDILDKNVWECTCGQGHLSEVLKEFGYNVKSTDLINRGYGEVQDFLKCEDKFKGDILTNPPFKLAKNFIEKSFELIEDERYAIFFLKIQFLESKLRKEMFVKYPLKYLIVNSERQQCAKDADFEKYKATTQCYCWYIFQKGYKGEPIVKWL